MSSITIYLTNSLGVPLSGQDVKLRRAGLSNFGVDYLTMYDVAGKPGKYETTDDYVTDRYKVWVNGSEDRSFGGPDGLEITKQSDILLKSGGIMTGNIAMGGNKVTGLPDATDSGDALKLGQGDDRYGKITSDNVWAGTQTFDDSTLFAGEENVFMGPVVVPASAEDSQAVNNSRMFSYVGAMLSQFAQSQANVLHVFPNLSNVEGKYYNSILGAVTYANAQSPNASKQFYIIIHSLPTNSDRLVAASGSIKDYVHLIGVDRSIRVIFDDYNGGSVAVANRCNISNLTVIFGSRTSNQATVLGNRLFTKVGLHNCVVNSYNDIHFQDGEISSCDLISSGSSKFKVRGTTDVKRTLTRNDIEVIDGDAVRDWQVAEQFVVPYDPTVPA